MNRFQKLTVLHTFLSHYHSGQWSRGYRYLCLAGAALRKYKYDPNTYIFSKEQMDLYRHLFNTQVDKV